ncbi:hypothetical protein EGC86_04405 [Shewanella frigidimarina]|uniref:hypothetical protein n=1 Tax=Shewanella frigidimarina TaxID=56812 RepID=UPI000F4FC69B|nr:hypothetical protein [Shewanella frigidimarina]RPA64511.1 hypothetical protein EGC86_04405 [Shewanella frigidimarina]
MSKLFKLKKWLTLEETTTHISNLLDEPISRSDLYKLALDGYLKLSVMFVNGAKAKRVGLVKTEDVEYKQVVPNIPDFPNGKGFHVPQNAEKPISKDYWIQKVEPKLICIGGVWDLAMIGAEVAEITNKYHQEISSHTVTIPCSTGHYLQKGDEIYQLQVRQEVVAESDEDNAPTVPYEHNDNEALSLQKMRLRLEQGPRRLPQYMVASQLADYDYILVIRTSEISRFIQSLKETSQDDKAISTNEKNSLLVLIAALCKEANVDWSQRGISTSLVAMTDLIGASLTDDTVRKILKQVPPAIESRSK